VTKKISIPVNTASREYAYKGKFICDGINFSDEFLE